MKTVTIRKINNFGKAGYIITKIGQIALLIAAIGCLVGAVLMCFVPKGAVRIELFTTNSAVIHLDDSIDFLQTFDLEVEDGILEIGQNTYEVIMGDEDEATALETTLYLSNIKWILFLAFIACSAAYVAFRFAGKLCTYFKDCDTPFSESIAKGLTNLAWSLIPLCVMNSLMESVTDSLLTGQFDIIIGLDLTTILLILCIFMLSFIFKHGTALQIESDETL